LLRLPRRLPRMTEKDVSTEERFATPRVEEVLKELPAEHPEAAYRRGYVDGWAGATETMRVLMFEDGLGSRAAHDACWSHWRNTLFEWYDRSSGEAEPNSLAVAYRRGYRDGWAEGTEAIWDLISVRGLRRQAGYDVCREHWQGELCEWAQGDYTKMVIPPRLRPE